MIRQPELPGRLMVCHAINRGDWIAEAVFDTFKGEYTPAEWDIVLACLDANRQSIKEFIECSE